MAPKVSQPSPAAVARVVEIGGGAWSTETVTRVLAATYGNEERAVTVLLEGGDSQATGGEQGAMPTPFTGGGRRLNGESGEAPAACEPQGEVITWQVVWEGGVRVRASTSTTAAVLR